MLRDGLCLAGLRLLVEPDPKMEPLPEPKSSRGKLVWRVARGRGVSLGRCGDVLRNVQGEEAGGSGPGVDSSGWWSAMVYYGKQGMLVTRTQRCGS